MHKRGISNQTLILVIVILILAGVGYYYFASPTLGPPDKQDNLGDDDGGGDTIVYACPSFNDKAVFATDTVPTLNLGRCVGNAEKCEGICWWPDVRESINAAEASSKDRAINECNSKLNQFAASARCQEPCLGTQIKRDCSIFPFGASCINHRPVVATPGKPTDQNAQWSCEVNIECTAGGGVITDCTRPPD